MGFKRVAEAIIFDFDGTLVDSEKITFELATPIISKYIGRQLSQDELNTIKGRVWKSAFKKWLPTEHEKLYDEIVENWRKVNPALPLYPNIRELLEELHNLGVTMAIVSSRERNLISNDLERLTISRFFKFVVGQEDTTIHKPKPEPLLMAAKLLKIEKNSIIYIGDQVTDITAARAAGIISGAAFWGEGDPYILKTAKPDFLFSEPKEVLRQLMGKNDLRVE